MSELIEQLLVLVKANLTASQRAMVAARMLNAKTKGETVDVLFAGLKTAALAKDMRAGR